MEKEQNANPVPSGYCVKCVIVGDHGVGKSSAILSFTQKIFPDSPPFVVDNYSIKIEPSTGIHINLGIWDTASTGDYEKLRPLSYPRTDSFIICFSMDNRDSFINVEKKWIPEINHHCPGVPFILAGLKGDLIGTCSRGGKEGVNEKPITEEESIEMAKRIGAAGDFIMCSSKDQLTVDKLFNKASMLPMNSRPRPACKMAVPGKRCTTT